MPRRLLVATAALLGGCAGPPAPDTVAPADTLLPVNGTHLFVHREGSGEPVLIVHGGPLLDHGYLVEPLRPLSDDFELVFYDQRLSGRSDGTVDTASISLAAFVADMEGIRTALGLEKIHLLGHSWGGLLAMEYALTHPDRLRSLVLVSPMPPSSALWQAEEAALRDQLQPADTAGMAELRRSPAMTALEPAAVERMLQLSFRPQLHDPTLAGELRFHIPDDYGHRSRQFARLGGELSTYDLLDSLPGLTVPTLLVHGDSEVTASIGVEALRATLPELTVHSIDRAAHFTFFERPVRFRRVVREFMDRRGRQ